MGNEKGLLGALREQDKQIFPIISLPNELPYMYICDFFFFQCSVVRHFVTPTYLTGNEECRTIEYLLYSFFLSFSHFGGFQNMKKRPQNI